MLKLTIAATAVFAAVGGGVIAGIPASAQVADNHDFRKSTSRSHNLASRHFHRNRNFNANAEDSINRLRLPFNSTNNVIPTVNVRQTPQAAVVTQIPAT